MRGPQPAELKLSETERKELEALVCRHRTPQQLVRRAQMILAAYEGKRNGQIARDMGASVGYGSRLAHALDWLAGALAGGFLHRRTTQRCSSTRATCSDDRSNSAN